METRRVIEKSIVSLHPEISTLDLCEIADVLELIKRGLDLSPEEEDKVRAFRKVVGRVETDEEEALPAFESVPSHQVNLVLRANWLTATKVAPLLRQELRRMGVSKESRESMLESVIRSYYTRDVSLIAEKDREALLESKWRMAVCGSVIFKHENGMNLPQALNWILGEILKRKVLGPW